MRSSYRFYAASPAAQLELGNAINALVPAAAEELHEAEVALAAPIERPAWAEKYGDRYIEDQRRYREHGVERARHLLAVARSAKRAKISASTQLQGWEKAERVAFIADLVSGWLLVRFKSGAEHRVRKLGPSIAKRVAERQCLLVSLYTPQLHYGMPVLAGFEDVGSLSTVASDRFAHGMVPVAEIRS